LINGTWFFTIYWVSEGLSLMDDLITRRFSWILEFLFAFCRFFFFGTPCEEKLRKSKWKSISLISNFFIEIF
jgi:hypothetical protein